MPKILRKFLFVFGGLGVATAVFFLGKGFFLENVPIAELSIMHWLTGALVDVLEVFLPIYLTALVVAFSYFIKAEDLPKTKGQGMSPAKTVLGAFFPVALGIIANSLIVLSILPALEDQEVRFHFLKQTVARLEKNLDRDRTKVKAGVEYFQHFRSVDEMDTSSFVIPVSARLEKLDKRIIALQQLLAIKPEDRFYTIEYYKTILARHEEEFIRSHSLLHFPGEDEMANWTLESLLENGEKFLKESEPTRANMAAILTLKGIVNLETGNAQDREFFAKEKPRFTKLKDSAKNLLETSWKAVKVIDRSPTEKEKASYFFRKGKSLGDFQFGNFLEAYYGFLELSKEDPEDKEVIKYLALSRQETEKTVVFKEIADEYFGLEGFRDIIFLNPNPGAEKGRPLEFVRIGQMVETQTGTYFKNLEVVALSRETGKPLAEGHYLAPYGRIANTKDFTGSMRVDLEARELNKPNSDFLPQKVIDDQTGEQLYKNDSQEVMAFTLRAPLGDLELVSNLNRNFRGLDLGSLYSQAQTLRSLGHTALPLETEFLSRILSSLEMFALGFWALFLAWLLRAKEGKTKWIPVVVLITLLPMVIWFMVEFFHWVARLGAALLIQVVGMWIAAGILVALVVPFAIFGVYFFWKRLSI